MATVIYAPASSSVRYPFFSNLANESSGLLPLCPNRYILLGDFNYSSPTTTIAPRAPVVWRQYISQFFVDCITDHGCVAQPTFHRGNSQSCIDYIFASCDLNSQRSHGSVTYITPSWSDHFLLTSVFHLTASVPSQRSQIGKGLWRAHPRLAKDSAFCEKLEKKISDTVAKFAPDLDVTLKWQELKSVTQKTAKAHSRKVAFDMAQAEKRLQHRRRHIMSNIRRNPDQSSENLPLLRVVERQLDSFQRYRVETLALRSGIRWRELGELSAGYLKKTIATRTAKQLVPPLIHPTTNVLCSSPEDMLDATTTFYSDLYSPEPIDQNAIDELLESLPPELHLSSLDQTRLQFPITFDDILLEVSHSPPKSSPGTDGIPYEILKLIVSHPDCREIVLAVYNNALSCGSFPESWNDTCVSLLPKKGNLSDLRKWRPISLINTDAKVFTRIINSRMIRCASKLVSPYQTGFVRNRFIADNGLLMRLLMDHAQSSHSSAIALFLDQEKAYDRIHPEYLRQVLVRFGFPDGIVDSVMGLFFNTELRLNSNGHLSVPVRQRRGLRQGDPLSPILFNLAFEPFLRRLMADPQLFGYSLPRSSISHPEDSNLQNVKLMAYADDVVCILRDPSDLAVLQAHLTTYSHASNAKVNYHKTQAMSLSGSSTFYLNTWRAPLLSHGISHWHDNRSLEPLVYLGFPLSSNLSQRNSFLEKLLSKIRSACNMHSQRSLSVRGRVTILNTLILSKLWHVLRLVSAPLAFFDKLKSIMSLFLTYRMFPKISLSTMCAQRSKGGLGVLDPNIQQGALQLRWLMPLMAGSPFWPFSPVWSSAAIRNSIVLPRLLDFFLYHLETRHSIDARNNGQPYEYTDFRLSFLFPDLRPSSTRRLDGVFSLLFKSMDLLPKNYRDVVVNPEICVRLPVASIYTNTDGLTISRSINRLLAGISYTIDPISHVLRPKALTELSQHPILAKRILTLVHNGTIVLHPFFVRAFIPDRFSHLASPPFIPVQHQDVDATPFLESLPLQQEGPKRALSTKLYRHSCTFSKKPIKLPNNLLPVKWSAFWSFPLLHQSRNVWYRLLHQKLPFKSFLHRICPNFFPYAGCKLCGLHEEDFLHFFLHCPLKIAVWQAIWLKFFTTSTFTPSAVLSALTLFKFPTLTSGVLDCPPSVVFGHTLLAIWRAQWSLAFDSVPFLPSRVITASYTLIQKSFDEHLVQHGMSHVPLPNIQF